MTEILLDAIKSLNLYKRYSELYNISFERLLKNISYLTMIMDFWIFAFVTHRLKGNFMCRTRKLDYACS